MGLISKIEDKLSGSSHKNDQKSYDTSSTGTNASVRQPATNRQQGTSSATGSRGSIDRDGYGTNGYNSSSQATQYNTTTRHSQGQQPGSYSTETRTAPSGYESEKMPTTTTNTTTHTNTDERQYYDPYSRKGQQTAANAAHGYGVTPSRDGSNVPNADANVARSPRGGVLNNTEHRRYGSQDYDRDNRNTNGGNDLSTISGEPALRHHYGRDPNANVGAGASSQPNYSHVQPTAGHVNAPNPTGSDGMTQAQKMGAAYEAGYRDAMQHMKSEMMTKFDQ